MHRIQTDISVQRIQEQSTTHTMRMQASGTRANQEKAQIDQMQAGFAIQAMREPWRAGQLGTMAGEQTRIMQQQFARGRALDELGMRGNAQVSMLGISGQGYAAQMANINNQMMMGMSGLDPNSTADMRLARGLELQARVGVAGVKRSQAFSMEGLRGEQRMVDAAMATDPNKAAFQAVFEEFRARFDSAQSDDERGALRKVYRGRVDAMRKQSERIAGGRAATSGLGGAGYEIGFGTGGMGVLADAAKSDIGGYSGIKVELGEASADIKGTMMAAQETVKKLEELIAGLIR